MSVTWERREGVTPCFYASTDGRWQLWPSDHHHGWELFAMVDGGPELVEWFETVALAKARAEREAATEAVHGRPF